MGRSTSTSTVRPTPTRPARTAAATQARRVGRIRRLAVDLVLNIHMLDDAALDALAGAVVDEMEGRRLAAARSVDG